MYTVEIREQLVDVLISLAHPSSSAHFAREAAYSAQYFLNDPAFSCGTPWENCENAAAALLAGAEHLPANGNAKETTPIVRTMREVAKGIFKSYRRHHLRLAATHESKFPSMISTIVDTVSALALTYDKAAVSNRTRRGLENDIEACIGKLCANADIEKYWVNKLCDPTVPENVRLHINEVFQSRANKFNIQTLKR